MRTAVRLATVGRIELFWHIAARVTNRNKFMGPFHAVFAHAEFKDPSMAVASHVCHATHPCSERVCSLLHARPATNGTCLPLPSREHPCTSVTFVVSACTATRNPTSSAHSGVAYHANSNAILDETHVLLSVYVDENLGLILLCSLYLFFLKKQTLDIHILLHNNGTLMSNGFLRKKWNKYCLKVTLLIENCCLFVGGIYRK